MNDPDGRDYADNTITATAASQRLQHPRRIFAGST